MAEARKCPKCGTELPTGVLGGRCPKCLGEVVFGISAGGEAALPAAGKPESIEGGPHPSGEYVEHFVPLRAPEFEGEHLGAMIGRYKLVEKIGEGGFGVVYRAEQVEPMHREVALKIIKAGMDTREVIARFEAERQALALMDHPNIARVLDAGATEAGRPYFVMELVRGIPITDYCDQQTLSTAERLALFMKVCHGVQHAHQKGIIHRDLKPSNVLVTLQDSEPVPKVIDFGVAKALGPKLTEKTLYTGLVEIIGTPAYMSPEQARLSSLDIDTRTDIYSLGVLLYELLTGVTPFDRRTLAKAALDEVLRMIRETEPLKPSTRLHALGEELTEVARHRQTEPGALSRLVRGDLDWIVMKAMEKDPARRYESANVLALDLQHYLQHEPVLATPPSVGYLVGKFVRRHRAELAVAGLLVGLLAVGTVTSTWLAIRATQARRDEAAARLRADEAARVADRQRERAEKGEQKAKESELAARQDLYAANMNWLPQAWEQNDLVSVRQLLEETATYPGRGFEWYYWQRQSHLELKTLRGHLGEVYDVAFSPDGRRIVTASEDQTAKVWDAASGREILTLKGHGGAVRSAAYSPDGQRIVTGSYDQTAKVWDAASGKELLTLKGHTHGLQEVAFSPDGQRVVSGSKDHTARVWEVATGKELLTFRGHSSLISTVAFSPDGQRIVSGGVDETGKVWEATTGKELLTLKGHGGTVRSAVFSPDGTQILTGSDDQTAKVWDAASGKELLTLKGHRGRIWSVAFSPDGKRIVTGSVDGDQTAKVWDSASGKELLTNRGDSLIASVAFAPDGRRIVTGSLDQTAKVWDLAGQEPLTFKGHTNGITSLAFSPDGQRIITGSGDQTARVWEVASGKELLTLKGHSGGIWSVAYSPDGQRIATGSHDHTAKVWEPASGKELLTLKHDLEVRSVAFSPDSQRIITGCADWTARLWEAATGKELVTLKHDFEVRSVAFSPDNQRIITGSADGTARLWEAATGKELLTLKGHSGENWSVALSPDGRRIVTASTDGTAKVREAATGKELLTLKGYSRGISSVAFSPDGQRIVTGSDDDTAKVWEATNGKQLLTLKGHNAPILAVAFSPDGRRILTGSADQTAKLWKEATADEVATWQKEQAAAEHLAGRQRELAAAEERDRASRAQDPGAIRQWLVLLPIAYEGREGARALQDEQVAEESRLRPRAGDRIKVGPSELAWRAVRLEDYQINFGRLAGATAYWVVVYAVSYIQSETNQTGVLLKVGSKDQAKIYLNGKEIYRCTRGRFYVPDQDVVTGVELKAGINVLVFKVVNELYSWAGSVRLTDAAGQPLKGIRVTLEPEAKD